jgi:two-component system response regulator RegA
MERPVNINLHESLEGVEDRSCLVMDDDGPFVQRLARALAQRGFIVSAVTNVAEGKDIARLNPPAFAVLDLRLEDGSGLDVVEVLQKSRPEARAVILTGYGAIATAVAAVKAGAVDYLSKPADVEDIIRALTATTLTRSLPRRKIRCRLTGSAGNTSSASMSCAITMSLKRPAV